MSYHGKIRTAMNSESSPLDRRTFLRTTALGAVALAGAPRMLARGLGTGLTPPLPEYHGPNVILIRFGGGVRRRESIADPANTWCPYLLKELVPRGVFYPRMEIDQLRDLNTSHGEGTLNLITGKYVKYVDAAKHRADLEKHLLAARFESAVPTIFEYLRGAFNVPDHQAIMINGEDRPDEEYYDFSNHHLFGVRFRSQTLSLRKYKTWLYRNQLGEGKLTADERKAKAKELAKFEANDFRTKPGESPGAALESFWQRWREHYGDSGFVNPRGDQLLTALALRSLKELRPKLMMVSYQDCDYVHWGYLSHYTNGIRLMDEGIRQLVAAVEADPEYRDNTVFVIAPDCGRDDNPFMAVPCQHHFNTRPAHEIFALVFGTGIARGQIVDKLTQQISVAATIGKLMGFTPKFAEAPVLGEVFA